MGEPLVSILTPTYNHERYIGDCIKGVLSQTYQSWELLIRDDGSSDATLLEIERFADARINVLRGEHKGPYRLAEIYNELLARASGSVVAILEGDDLWPPDKLEVQIRDFQQGSARVSSGMTSIVDEDGKEVGLAPLVLPARQVLENSPAGAAGMFMLHPEGLTFTFPVATCIRREALEAIGGFSQPPYLPVADYVTLLNLSLQGAWCFHKRVLGIWRRRAASVTSTKMPEILSGVYRAAYEFIAEKRGSLPAKHEDLDALDRQWDAYNAQLLMMRGRLLASAGQWSAARRAFRQVRVFRPGPRTLLQAKLAEALCLAKIAPEPMFRAIGRPPIEVQSRLASGEAVVSADWTPPAVRYSWRT